MLQWEDWHLLHHLRLLVNTLSLSKHSHAMIWEWYSDYALCTVLYVSSTSLGNVLTKDRVTNMFRMLYRNKTQTKQYIMLLITMHTHTLTHINSAIWWMRHLQRMNPASLIMKCLDRIQRASGLLLNLQRLLRLVIAHSAVTKKYINFTACTRADVVIHLSVTDHHVWNLEDDGSASRQVSIKSFQGRRMSWLALLGMGGLVEMCLSLMFRSYCNTVTVTNS